MSLSFSCISCGKIISAPESSVGRQGRCRHCGEVQPIPGVGASGPSMYGLAPVDLATVTPRPPIQGQPGNDERPPPRAGLRRLLRAGVLESSRLEREVIWLILLSVADLIVTYRLLATSPAFYESNPVAQFFFARWNIAGMAVFKFGLVGFIAVSGEVIERHRPGLGRLVVGLGCLAAAAVVCHGLRLLMNHGG